jgi:Ca2+-binding RTX toxin-like protein
MWYLLRPAAEAPVMMQDTSVSPGEALSAQQGAYAPGPGQAGSAPVRMDTVAAGVDGASGRGPPVSASEDGASQNSPPTPDTGGATAPEPSPAKRLEQLRARTKARREATLKERKLTHQGTMESDTIEGGEGNDSIAGDWGDDLLGGAEGDDWIDGEGGDDVIEGGPGDDSLLGGDGDNYLEGGPGNDNLHAEHGLDTLEGGPGADTLYGGGDADVFAYGEGSDDGMMDTIGDFSPAEHDVLFLGELLLEGGYGGDGSAASLDGYVRMEGNVLYVDRDGGGDAWVPLADLGGTYSLEDLIAGQNLIVRAEDFPAPPEDKKKP